MKNILFICMIFILACKANTKKSHSELNIFEGNIQQIINDWNIDSLGLLGLRYSHMEEFVVKYDFSKENRLSFLQKFGKPNFVYEDESRALYRYNLKCMQYKSEKIYCEVGFYIEFDKKGRFVRKGTNIYD
jgi:hypothetical protein